MCHTLNKPYKAGGRKACRNCYRFPPRPARTFPRRVLPQLRQSNFPLPLARTTAFPVANVRGDRSNLCFRIQIFAAPAIHFSFSPKCSRHPPLTAVSHFHVRGPRRIQPNPILTAYLPRQSLPSPPINPSRRQPDSWKNRLDLSSAYWYTCIQ